MADKRKRGTVLVVEDDPEIQAALRALIERAGFGTRVTSSWLEATQLLEKLPHICLVLVDAFIPGADEFAVRTAQRARYAVATIPVRLLRTDGEIVKRAVHLEILLDVVREQCGSRLAAVF